MKTLSQTSEWSASTAAMAKRRFVNFALWTGMLRNEIVNLEWSDVDMDRKVLTVRNKIGFRTKSRRSRTVPMNPQLSEMLAELKANGKSKSRVFSLNY